MSEKPANPFIQPTSLADTLDKVNAALFYRTPIPTAERLEVAGWIADRQGLPGAYAGMFAPTQYDYSFGALTFTGDPVRSGAGTGHMLSEESLYVLNRLGQDSAEVRYAAPVREAIEKARKGILRRLAEGEIKGEWSGVYCCGTCTVALWRHLLSTGIADDCRRLEHGLAELRRARDGKGRWRRFPFYYTLLALSEINLPAVRDEVEYALPVIERAMRRILKEEEESEGSTRKRILMQRVLEKC